MITELKDIIEQKLGFSFYYGELAWQNLIADDATFPLGTVDFIQDIKFDLAKTGFIGEEYPVSIYLCDKSQLDWTTLEHEVVICSMTTAARKLLSNLQNYKDANGNKIIDSIKVESANRVILRKNDDVGTSGIFMRLSIKPNVNKSVCI